MSKTDPEDEISKPKAALREAGAKAREVGGKALAAGAKARDELEQASAKAREGIEQAARKSRDIVAATREKSEAVIEDTREKTMRAAAETNRLFYEHPITAVAAAAAAGAVLGIFLPRFNIAGRAGKIAGQAVKAAVGSEAGQRIWSGVRDRGKAEAPDEEDGAV